MSDGYRIFPLGDSALTIEFGDSVSVDLNERAITLSGYLESHPFPGLIETVPAYASTTVFFDIRAVRDRSRGGTSAFEIVRSRVEEALSRILIPARSARRRVLEIPVHFAGDDAPDLNYVAQHSRLSPAEVIEIFLSGTYRVYMLGFLPGFTYMAEVDERITVPRRDEPRHSVPAGSVGIAGKQTGVYSLDSPGGWQIIGRTDVEMFTPNGEQPTLASPGDEVRFVRAE